MPTRALGAGGLSLSTWAGDGQSFATHDSNPRSA